MKNNPRKMEAIRLRQTTDLSTEDIARQVGVLTVTAYKYLKGMHWRRRRWVGTTAPSWTSAEDDLVRKLWPCATKAEIRSKIPGRGWEAIERHASYLKVKRDVLKRDLYANRFKQDGMPVDPICSMLRKIRIDRKITVTKLASDSEINRASITHWELGFTQPSISQLRTWSSALGKDLLLVAASAAVVAPIAASAAAPETPIPVQIAAAPVVASNKGFSLFDGEKPSIRPVSSRYHFVSFDDRLEPSKPLPRSNGRKVVRKQRDFSELRPPTEDEVMQAAFAQIEKASRCR